MPVLSGCVLNVAMVRFSSGPENGIALGSAVSADMGDATFKIDFRFTSKLPFGLSSDLASNRGSLVGTLGTFNIAGPAPSPLLTINGNAFNYDPSWGNLLMQVSVLGFTRMACCGYPLCCCLPRYRSAELLMALQIARAAADPAVVPDAARPGGFAGLAYFRLHGSPNKYRSAYGDERLRDLAAAALAARSQDCWLMFDNTASGAAAADALLLLNILQKTSAADEAASSFNIARPHRSR